MIRAVTMACMMNISYVGVSIPQGEGEWITKAEFDTDRYPSLLDSAQLKSNQHRTAGPGMMRRTSPETGCLTTATVHGTCAKFVKIQTFAVK